MALPEEGRDSAMGLEPKFLVGRVDWKHACRPGGTKLISDLVDGLDMHMVKRWRGSYASMRKHGRSSLRAVVCVS